MNSLLFFLSLLFFGCFWLVISPGCCMVPRLPSYLNRLMPGGGGGGVIERGSELLPHFFPPQPHHNHSHNPQQQGVKAKIAAFLRRFLVKANSSDSHGAPQRRERCLVIGVHGWFPTRLLQQFVGIPTGTSTRLSSMLAAAITRQHPDWQVERVAVEGDGGVGERVAKHWEQLAPWRARLKDFDRVILIGHSQGVPVACLLAARLLQHGGLDDPRNKPKLAVVGLAGVLAGARLSPMMTTTTTTTAVTGGGEPPPGVGAATRELFALGNPQTPLAQSLTKALSELLTQTADTRLCLVAGLMDPVVPLVSSLRPDLKSPQIWRAIHSSGGGEQASTLLTALLNLALILLHEGHAEAGLLLVALQEFATGSLYYQRRAHSALHADPAVYDLAARWILHPAAVGEMIPSSSSSSPSSSPSSSSSSSMRPEESLPWPIATKYHLPWIIRGLLGEKKERHSPAVEKALQELQQAVQQQGKPSELARILSPMSKL